MSISGVSIEHIQPVAVSTIKTSIASLNLHILLRKISFVTANFLVLPRIYGNLNSIVTWRHKKINHDKRHVDSKY